jgi:hypothetical protein
MRYLWTLILLGGCGSSAAIAPDLAVADLTMMADAAVSLDGAGLPDLASAADGASCLGSTPLTTLYLDECTASSYCFRDYDPQSFF